VHSEKKNKDYKLHANIHEIPIACKKKERKVSIMRK
jgi:hypothetical protein